MTFNDVVEVVKNLSTDEKCEIQILLQKYIREESRDRILVNFKQAQAEQERGELIFSSDIRELQKLMEE